MSELQKILKELIGLTESDWEVFRNKLKRKEFKAKTPLVSEGNISKNIYFIESGLLRTYHLLDGNEINTYFACDNQIISTFSSFIRQTASVEILETIEDSIVQELSFQNLTQLYKESVKFEKLGRIWLNKIIYVCWIGHI